MMLMMMVMVMVMAMMIIPSMIILMMFNLKGFALCNYCRFGGCAREVSVWSIFVECLGSHTHMYSQSSSRRKSRKTRCGRDATGMPRQP